jgi:Methyltransferase domain
MDEALRRAWTEIVTPKDYEEHMASIGQAQAGADLTRHLLETASPSRGSRVVFAGAGTGQMLDFLHASLLRPFRLVFTDLNPRFLECLKRRLAQLDLHAEIIEDDFEHTALASGPDLLIATLLLEHIDWRRGVQTISALRPAACGIIIQENPPEMKSAITPGRALPPSIAEAASHAHPVLVSCEQLVPDFASRGYQQIDTSSRDVADGKRLLSVLFRQKLKP